MPPEGPAKKTTKAAAPKDVEWKKNFPKESDNKSVDNAPRATQGAGEVPASPKPPKLKKPKEKPKLLDSVPKKNAQRAKGCTSLNKTIESIPDAELKPERRRPASSTEKLSKCEAAPAEHKTLVPTPKRKKKREPAEKTEKVDRGEKPEKAEKPEKVEKRPTSKPKPAPSKEPSRESVSEQTLEVVQMPAEAKSDEIQTVNATSFNSCSFFEKLQQGVKAYFSSRSSFSSEDRNKKEGGIRTRGRVGKGVKEEVKKSKPGIKIKNNNPEIDFFYDRLSFLGGQSNNFLSTKPKIFRHFRKLKRKKLYHPKKCYVRIQIPRKGYFYRSTVGLPSPECASADPLQPRFKTEISSKSQVSGLAPARSKADRLQRSKKGVKKQRPPDREPEGAQPEEARPEEAQPSDPFTHEYMQELLSEFGGWKSDINFEQRVQQYVTLNWPEKWKEISFEDSLVGFESARPGGEDPRAAALESPTDAFKERAMGELPGAGSEMEIGEKRPGDSAWDALLDSLSGALGKSELLYNAVEVSPAGAPAETGGSPSWDESLRGNEEMVETEVSRPDSTTILMGGVDLHVELQNYIKAIESFHTAKSRTKNTLQCNFHDNYIPLKIYSSSQELHRAEEYFDVTENKSGTSFNSATSDCPQLEEVTNEMLLDVNADAPPTFDEIRKAKSENDPGDPQQQDSKCENSVKRTAGITSFQAFRLNDKSTWGSPFLVAVSKSLFGGDSNDDYEKIQPYGSDTSTQSRRKIKSSILFRNSLHSLSAEFVPQGVQKAVSERLPQNQIPPVESVLPRQTSNPEVILPDAQPGLNASNWSPTLQELIDIYNSVLKQNTKIRRNSKNMVSGCLSSHLFSFLTDKLKEKHYKSDLINTSKELRERHKPSKLGKPVKNNNDLVKLQEYVAIFQQILHSSLSISQIARLNNIISGLQNYSQRNYKFVKDLNEDSKKQVKNSLPEKVETKQPEPSVVETKPKSSFRPRTSMRITNPTLRKPTQTNRRKPEPIEKELKIKKTRKCKMKPKTKPAKAPPKEKIVKTKLSSPTELESILKLCFNSNNAEQLEMDEEKKKILVTVRLLGNQVLVNGFSYFSNEKSLKDDKSEGKETSELIIENVTKKQMPTSDVWWRNTKSSKLRIENQPQVKPIKKKKESKDQKKKPIRKFKMRAPTKRRKQKMTKIKKTEEDNSDLFELENKDMQQQQTFEYDQQQLRVQHPINAIAETSESKVSQYGGILEVDYRKAEPPGTKFLLLDNPAEVTETLKAVLEEKVCSKDLICDFGWEENKLTNKVNRVRSCQLVQQEKRRSAIKKKRTKKVRSMMELKKRSSSRTAGQKTMSLRPRKYLCYSSEQKLQGKCPSKKTSSEKRPPGGCRSPAPNKKRQKSNEQHKKEVTKKTSKETELRYKKWEQTTSKPETPNWILLGTPVGPSFHEFSTDTFSINSDATIDSCKVEFLYSEKSKKPLSGDCPTEKRSAAGFDSALSIQKNNSFTSAESNTMESSIALLPPGSCNDCISFLADVIHSDSFLVNFPSHVVSQSKMKSLFKCNSDLKFYPGRLQEGITAEEKPLVTFVLTPSQHEQAMLPENQVKVVRKGGSGGSDQDSEKKKIDETEEENEDARDMKTLKSIEEFITYLSKCRKEAIRRQNRLKKEAEKKKLEASKGCSKNKTIVTNQKPKVKASSARKALHEPLKRKMTEPIQGKVRKSQMNVSEQLQKKNILANTDLMLDKMVNNLSHALKTLRQERLMKQNKRDRKTEKLSGQKCETKIGDNMKTEKKRNVKYNLTGMSMDPTEIPPELVTAIKMAIAQAEGFEDKEEIIAAIGDGLSRKKRKQMESVETSCDLIPKKQKEVKIKIHCNEQKRQESIKEESPHPEGRKPQQQNFVSPPAAEIGLLDSLVSRDTQGGDLKRRNSTYFDAVEKVRGEQMGGDSNRIRQPAAEGAIDLNLEFGVQEEKKQKPRPTITASDEQLLSKDVLGKKSEELIYTKIAKSLEEGRVTYSMALLEGFLKKSEDSDSDRLKKLLTVIESKSRNIMINMERGAWQKVLSLLEEVARVLESEEVEDSKKTQLATTKHFIDKIQLLNIRRLSKLQNFCSSFANTPKQTHSSSGNVLERIKQSLKVLKQKLILKRNAPSRNLEKVESSELEGDGSALKIHSTLSVPEIRENATNNEKKPEESQDLRKKLQQQYSCLQQLLTVETDENAFVPLEIQEVRRAVEAKMRLLQRAFEGRRAGAEMARLAEDCWSRATSLLRVARGCRRGAEEPSKETPEGTRLERSPGYVDMVKSLIKVWDTRMTIASITSDCYT